LPIKRRSATYPADKAIKAAGSSSLISAADAIFIAAAQVDRLKAEGFPEQTMRDHTRLHAFESAIEPKVIET
jgi:hypothetical protein